jgi:hypothetical protein
MRETLLVVRFGVDAAVAVVTLALPRLRRPEARHRVSREHRRDGDDGRDGNDDRRSFESTRLGSTPGPGRDRGAPSDVARLGHVLFGGPSGDGGIDAGVRRARLARGARSRGGSAVQPPPLWGPRLTRPPIAPPACYVQGMAFGADVLVMARDVPDLLLVAEVKRDLGDVGAAETQLRRYMLARRCSVGLLVTPEHTRIYRDTFADFTEGSVQLVGEFSTAEVLNLDTAPADETALREAVREWLDRMAASWPSALPRTDAARAPVVQYLVPEVADGRVSSGSFG